MGTLEDFKKTVQENIDLEDIVSSIIIGIRTSFEGKGINIDDGKFYIQMSYPHVALMQKLGLAAGTLTNHKDLSTEEMHYFIELTPKAKALYDCLLADGVIKQ
jgi:hypothetical protein